MAGLSTLLAACGGTDVRSVAIVAHYVPECAPEGGGPEQLELIALGDFDRSNDSVSILASDAAREPVSLPSGTRAAELSTLSDRSYWGMGELDAHNQIPILLWPQNQACRLAPLGPLDIADDGRWLLGFSSRSARVLALGESAGGSVIGRAVRLTDGRIDELASNIEALPSHASISELGSGLLVAGGEDPQTGLPRAGGWVLDFDPDVSLEARELASARARHAALSLPSGSTLLVGGQAQQGEPLASVEIVASDGRASQVLELLETPRIEPHAVLLGGGRILVGGGYSWSDIAAGERVRQPVASVEFYSTDLAEGSEAPILLEPAALDRAFVALGGGAALAVGGCQPGPQSGDCAACEDGSGCVSRAAWWIDPRGVAHELAPLPLSLAAARPRLVPAAEGAPWLIADGALGRFDPWRAQFDVVPVTLPAPRGSLLTEPRALSPGSFAWVTHAESGVQLVALYHSLRGRFTQDVAPLLVGTGRGVLPLRPPNAEAGGETTLAYGAASGLELAGSAAVAGIADTDYADFTLELTLRSGPPPLLRLVGAGEADDGDGTSFGGLECPWPDIALDVTLPLRLRVRRRGDEIRLLLDPATAAQADGAPCRRALPERVSIQLLGTRAGTTVLSRIEIRRSVD